METIGTKITQLRKQKALSQENLAELSKVNVRTIQRIENNETTPRGATLKLICDTLGNVILPLILWLTNKNKVQYTDEQGKNILNFQIIYSAIIFLLLFFGALGKILHTDSVTFGNVMISFEVTLVIVFLLGTINFFFPIINAIRISKGTVKNFYPTIIRFIK